VFGLLQDLTAALLALLLLVWAIAGINAGRLVYRPTHDALRRGAYAALLISGVGAVIFAARVAVVGVTWASSSWDIVEHQVTIEIPLLLAPLTAVAVLSAPRMWSLGNTGAADFKKEPDAAARAAASDPRLVVPVQVTVVGVLLSAYVVVAPLPGLSYPEQAIRYGGPLAAATALLWLRQRRRQRRLSGVGAVRRPLRSRAVWTVGVLAAIAGLAVGGFAYGMSSSRLPDRFSMMNHGDVDYGGGPRAEHAHHSSRTVTVDLTGPRFGIPDRSFTLTAIPTQLRLASGAMVSAWTFNGRAPGPELRVRHGDLVEVTVVNRLPDEGVTIHWHGLDVPNAEDGVAGLTQKAVAPGDSYTYRFRAEQIGTFWYHTHQASSEAVARGLFGAFVVMPRNGPGTRASDLHRSLDFTVVSHAWQTPNGPVPALGTADTRQRRLVAAGTSVRLRLVNTSNNTAADDRPTTFSLTGTTFQVAAIDGTDLNRPTDLDGVPLPLATGGRYDLTFTMPNRPVLFTDLANPEGGLLLSPNGTGAAPPVATGAAFDATRYGTPAPTPFGASSQFDRHFRLILTDNVGFFDGRFGLWTTINGRSFPDAPMLMVNEGDLVKMTLINRSGENHPMHLHGHHALVLAHNGRDVEASPWWTDTLDILPGETFEIAFRADNPGLWMDHCHNLEHAADGMVTHLGYVGVTSPFQVGQATSNQPE
jgi:FtsP/CotA-like multicopper oxidase with cupredoxin domain